MMNSKRISFAFLLCCLGCMTMWLWLLVAGCADLGTPPLPDKPFCPTSYTKEYYYYYFHQKKSLILRTDQIALQFISPKDTAAVQAFCAQASPLLRTDSLEKIWTDDDTVHSIPWDIWAVRLVAGLAPEQVERLFEQLEAFQEVYFATPAFYTNDSFRYKIYLTNEFSVGLIDSTRTEEMTRANMLYGLRQRKDTYRNYVYYLEVPKSLCRNSLEMANYYLENYSTWLQWAEPNSIDGIRPLFKGTLKALTPEMPVKGLTNNTINHPKEN